MTPWRRTTLLWLAEDEPLCCDSLKTEHCAMTHWRRSHCAMTRWRLTTVLWLTEDEPLCLTRWRRTTVLWLPEDEPLCYDSLKTNHCVMTRWKRTTGNGISFRKIPWNRLGKVSVIPRKKVVIPRHSEVYGRVNSEARNGTEWHEKKLVLQNILQQQTELTACFLPRNASERNSESLLLFLLHGTEFRVGFSSAEWFWTEFREFASIFVPWYRIPSFFLLRGMIRNGIPRVFCSAEQPEFRQNKPVVPSIPSSAE